MIRRNNMAKNAIRIAFWRTIHKQNCCAFSWRLPTKPFRGWRKKNLLFLLCIPASLDELVLSHDETGQEWALTFGRGKCLSLTLRVSTGTRSAPPDIQEVHGWTPTKFWDSLFYCLILFFFFNFCRIYIYFPLRLTHFSRVSQMYRSTTMLPCSLMCALLWLTLHTTRAQWVLP